MTSVTIPNSVTSIGSSVFYNCSSLTSVTIPNGVPSIEDMTFYDCRSLTSVTIPNSVTSIGSSAFYNCRSLTSVTIPNGVTSIGRFAFSHSSLTSVTLPSSVTSIEDYTFQSSSLTGLTIPSSVTSIGRGAFNRCSSLTSITIPNSVTSIGDYAFYKCSSLTIYCLENSIAHKYAVDNKIKYSFESAPSSPKPTVPVETKKVLVSSVTLNPKEKTLDIKESFMMTPTFIPSNATNKTVSYKSSNPSIVIVNSKGVVTAKKTGSSIITVTATDGSNAIAKCTIIVRPATSKSIKVKKKTKTSVKITWKKVSGVNGYEVYRSMKNNKGFKKAATFKGVNKVSHINKKLKKKGTYYYKVRSYKMINSKMVYSGYSNAGKVKL